METVLDKKLFCLKVDDLNSIFFTTFQISDSGFSNTYTYETTEVASKWSELDKEELKILLTHIKRETSYTNSLAFDFLTLPLSMCSTDSLDHLFNALLVSFLLLPLTLPITVLLLGLEYLCITPLKGLINILQKNEDEAFLTEVFSPDNASSDEIRKNARILAQGYRTHSMFNNVAEDVLCHIAAFTGDNEIHSAKEADDIARSHFFRA